MAIKELNDVNKDGVDDSMQVKDQSKLGDHGPGKDVGNPELRKPEELNPPEGKRPPDKKEVPEIDPEDDEALQAEAPPAVPTEGGDGRGGFSEADDAVVTGDKERSSDTPPEQCSEEAVEKDKKGQPGIPPEGTDKLRAEAEGKPKLPTEADLSSDETKTKEAGQPSVNPEDVEERDVKVVSGEGKDKSEPPKQNDAEIHHDDIEDSDADLDPVETASKEPSDGHLSDEAIEQVHAVVVAPPAESEEGKEASPPAEIDPEDDAALLVEPKAESADIGSGVRENADSDEVAVGSNSVLIDDTAGVHKPDVKPEEVDAKDFETTETTDPQTIGASDQTRLHEPGVHADGCTQTLADGKDIGDAHLAGSQETLGRDGIIHTENQGKEKDLSGAESSGPSNPGESPENIAPVEHELRSPFARENFKVEDSFDTHAKIAHPELNDLKSKCVYDVHPMSTPNDQIDRSSKGEYTDEERAYIKDIRDSVDAPTTETKMQKVIGVDTGNINEDLKHYLEPNTRDGKPCDAHVTGYVAKAEDTAPFTKTPQKCFDNLRLDYDPGEGKENPYKNPEQPVYVIRFTDGINYEIPYSKEFGGNTKESQPFTGNGFVSSKGVSIPEYKVRESDGMGAVVTDGEIYRIYPDGTEEMVAKYNKQDKCFELLKKEADT